MAIGRFVCVALPLILVIGSIISLLVATLAGVTHNDLRLFTVDLSELDISNLGDIAEDLGVDLGNIDLGDIADNAGDEIGDIVDSIGGRSLKARQTVTAGDLGFDITYQITLWGYCSVNGDGDRECTDPEFNWANEKLNLTQFEEIGDAVGLDINLPESLMSALRIFRTVIMWAQIAFIVALSVLGLELVIGIFSNFSRVFSCLTWAIAIVATVLVFAAAGLATATAAVVVGAIEASDELFGAQASIDTNFLVAIWIAAALSLASGLFWIFTICCCKPDRRSRRDKHHSTDGEKLLPTGNTAYAPLGNDQPYGLGIARDFPSSHSRHDSTEHQAYGAGGDSQAYAVGNNRAYTPIHDEHEMTSGNYYNHTQPQFDPTYTSTGYTGTPTRSDLGYEPYSHRA